ncbi:MAG: XrtA system polysaccharide deacetylase [Rhodospirillales bacterium]
MTAQRHPQAELDATAAPERWTVNALTVDVEDYYQVSAFAPFIAREDWAGLPSRVERNTERVLELMDAAGARGTFFTLGWVAERHPALIRRIVAGGHELASHGYAHFRVRDQAPDEFRADVRRTKALLEDVSGTAVAGYRAASFSIDGATPWAHAVLAEEGYAYSSSVYPVRHDHYGMPDAPRFTFRPDDGGGIVEVPVTTVRLMGRNLPCAGGGYFRLLPYAVSSWAIRRVNRRDGAPAIFYFHPWEIDPEQPRQAGIDGRTRFRHYVNLRRTEARLRRLLAEFRWDRMDRVFIDGAGTAR